MENFAYKVIRDFPNNKDFPVGSTIALEPPKGEESFHKYEVEDCQGKRTYTPTFFDKYPHLFERV